MLKKSLKVTFSYPNTLFVFVYYFFLHAVNPMETTARRMSPVKVRRSCPHGPSPTPPTE